MPVSPRVTIILPTFNDESTVADTLRSCLSQTLTDIEIICVDDASSDRTPEIIAEYGQRDPRIRLVRSATNRSAFQARRVGVQLASAPYILFVDGDDELLPTLAERTVREIERRQADLVGFAVEVVSTDGTPVGGYQKRLKPMHRELRGAEVLAGLFPAGEPAQGQLWRYLFRTDVLREAYARLPQDIALPRVNDLPVMFLVAALSQHYVSIDDRLYRYHFGRGGSGQAVTSEERAAFYVAAVESVGCLGTAVRTLARSNASPTALLDSFESARYSVIGNVCAYLMKHTTPDLLPRALELLSAATSATDLAIAATGFCPEWLPELKRYSLSLPLPQRPVRHVMLATPRLTTGGVSSVVLAQTEALIAAGYEVTIVCRRHGNDPSLVPEGAGYIEMAGRGLFRRLIEWAELCRGRGVDLIIDHQILYCRDWPEFVLTARGLGVPTIGWIHSFAARPIFEQHDLISLITANATLLQTLVTLSPLDVAFWKLRGIAHAVFLPNPIPAWIAATDKPKRLDSGPFHLVWWGRLDERTKRVSELLAVAEELSRLGVNFDLTVIGPDWGGMTAQRFNADASERGLGAVVRAVGEKRGDDLLAAIDAADAFISTSVIEGYQLTIAEAQLRGLPVFMYDLPWLTLLRDNDGVVSAPQGDAAALAAAVASAAGSPQRFNDLAAAALAAARRETTRDYSALYVALVEGTLPPEFSPDPTLADAKTLLDLTIFFAEHVQAPRHAAKVDARTASRSGRIKAVLWQTLAPTGRLLMQGFPAIRPFAHRMKARLGAGSTAR